MTRSGIEPATFRLAAQWVANLFYKIPCILWNRYFVAVHTTAPHL